MFPLNVNKILSNTLPVFFLSYLLVFPAHAAMYLKFDGVDGEATAAGHEGWIEILSVSESISRPDAGSTGATRRRGAAEFSDIEVSKLLDRTSPKLREALAQGKVYPKVEIHITRSCIDAAQATYFSYELTNSMLNVVSLSGTNTASPPVEELSMNFERIKWTYDDLDTNCDSRGKVEASWNIEQGVP